MLSEVIHSRLSYGALPLARQLPHQRSVHFGPLVLEANLLKNRTPAADRRPTCLTHVFTYFYVHWTVTLPFYKKIDSGI